MKICTENTHNYWGGLDRARILNTSVYSGIKFAHSVMFSLSKGLSAPIGSVLVGDEKRGVLALAISRREDDTDIWVRG